MNETLEKRTMSGFPVSIGTSLALESLFEPVQKPYDESRIIPEMIDLSNYDVVLFNISTLLRNIVGSIPYSEVGSITPYEYKEVLLDEILYLEGLFGMLDCTMQPYINKYDKVLSMYDETTLRAQNASKQRYTTNVIDLVQNDLKLIDDILVFNGDLAVTGEAPNIKAIIITHIPYDLLSYRKFNKLDLLETHTGILKTRKDWYTKYFPVPDTDMSFLPFSKELLPILGDHVMFKPAYVGYRKALVSHLQAKMINPLTNDGTLKILIPQVPNTKEIQHPQSQMARKA